MSEHSEATPPRAKEAGPRTEIIQTQSAPAAGNGKPGLPAVIPQPEERPRRRMWAWVVGVLLILAAGGGGGYYWWQQSLAKLPDGIAWSNGRIERDEIDIDTKYAGRVSEILVKEGDIVKAGQPVARMQSDDLKASLDRAEDQVSQAQHAVHEASAARDQQQTLVNLAKRQLDRTRELISRGNATRELLDQRQQQFDAASAALGVAKARVSEAKYGLQAAEHQAEIYKVNIADNTLVAPRDGRIQYRIANVGEVLPAGGRVFTMLDLSSVYMDVFLPTLEAGKVSVGSEARIVLDAYPDDPGDGVLRRVSGAVHAQDGRDQERAGQAHVPRQGPGRSRYVARPGRQDPERAAGHRLCPA